MPARRIFVLVSALGGLILLTGASRPREASVQLRFGVDMAQTGAWKEAEFRFRRAAELAPDDAEVRNNLAVAYESNGRYDEAELAYQQALDAAGPAGAKIRENYERFRVFYSRYLDERSGAAVEAPSTAEAAQQPAPGDPP